VLQKTGSPDGKYIFVTTPRAKGVVIIETATNKPIASMKVGKRPGGIAVTDDGNVVFTANGPSNHVSIVDVVSRSVKCKVTVGAKPRPWPEARALW
jgi:YVTN family beta-propeller protein